jgi:type IV secretory pathway TrbF-like protein
MNLSNNLKRTWPRFGSPKSGNNVFLSDGRRAGENDNPYLSARRTWNDHVGAVVAARNTWQLIGILSLLIVLSCVGGLIYIGSQSRFIPIMVLVDKLSSETRVATPASNAAPDEQRMRVVRAAVAQFVANARMVTPDIALQRNAVFKVYAMLAPNDPATTKMNEWLNGTKESSPFKRAERETVSTEIKSVLQQTADTWQVDWIETVRDRDGILKGQPFRMRALVNVYTSAPTSQTTEEQVINNPIGTYCRDFSWSKQL